MNDKSSKRGRMKAKREHRVTFMLNYNEYKAIENYLCKHKIPNKSKWFRTTILTCVWKAISDDYPTLFNENEMR